MTDESIEAMDVARQRAVEAFAETLRRLRVQSGNPSFRELAGRSKAISHTTLHEAAQGHRLPSWSTVVEFAKACGVPPAELNDQWVAADLAVRTAAASSSTSSAPSAPEPMLTTEPTAPEPAAAPPAPAVRQAWPVRRVYLAFAGAGLATGVMVALLVSLMRGGDPASPAASAPAAPQGTAAQLVESGLTAADCPVRGVDPPPAPPRHAGDASAFLGDITYPDCSHVAAGSTVVKIWRLKNMGTVTWSGYTLHRLELPETADQCQTIADVAVPTTAPGGVVDVKVDVTTPQKATFCFVRFKMYDGDGQLAFPGSRPVNLQLIVDPPR